MNQSPIAYSESLRIGKVDFVSPDEIKVVLDIEAPESIALNTGSPRPFPRINGYVLIPSDDGYLVGQVEWITVEHSQFPKRKGMQDFGLIDLPFPLRKLSLNPLGSLTTSGKKASGEQEFRFRRGVESFPSVGDPVLLPTSNQLTSIIESGDNRRVKIGTSPLAESAEVKIDPDRLFGRHLAVLGNTGSGKSCSVAGLIRWSLDAAQKACSPSAKPNARFIVLDPNGEYSRAFSDFENVRIFAVDAKSGNNNAKQLQIPLWFWNSAEWFAFTRASHGAQRPLLSRAIREMRNGGEITDDPIFSLRRKVSTILISLRNQLRAGDAYEGWKIGPKLEKFREDINAYAGKYSDHQTSLNNLAAEINHILTAPRQSYTRQDTTVGYNAFSAHSLEEIENKIDTFLQELGGLSIQMGPGEDSPIQFDGLVFAEHFAQLASAEAQPQFFDYLLLRIRTLLSDTRLKTIIGTTKEVTLESWLATCIGDNEASNGTVTIIDLSLVPSEVVHILTSVIARMTFESLQRYRRNHSEHKVLPTVLVMEEAHTFVRRYKEDAENHDAAATCCQLFERIAREGRKFGLGLVLSSQRPSELSPTVLSQCNTFLLHRISNDKDQELVHKLVPDNLKGLLRDLPSLPSQNAILLGWASELPVLVRMNNLPEAQQPQSNDPDFWDVWSGTSDRKIDWKNIADQWQEKGSTSELPTLDDF